MDIEVVLDAGATIGQSPTWVSAEKALYWIDVKKPALYRYDPAAGGQRSWPMPDDIGAFALVFDLPGAVVALRQGIFRLDFKSGSLTQLAPPPFYPALFRFNEGACDSAGRFWIGVMFDPLDATVPPQEDEQEQYGLPIARVTYSLCDNDTRLVRHALDFMRRHLQAAGAREIWNQEDDTCHLNGTERMGDDPRTSVVNADCRCWDIPNLGICDGSGFPTVGGVNPSLTIQAIACSTADRIEALPARGELSCGAR